MTADLKESAYQLGHGGNGIVLIHGFCGSARQMRRAARERYEQYYTASAMTEQVTRVYERMLAGQPF